MNYSMTPAPMNDPNTDSAQKNIADVTHADTQNINKTYSEQNPCDKNITTAETSQVAVADSDNFSGKQILENLPAELLNQKRFFPVKITSDRRKLPCIKAWQLPNNQMTAQEAIKKTGLIGMDICGHGLNPDYFFVDFDHVKDQSGNFLYEDAERWNNYLSTAETFSETSISKDGTHYLFCPTPNLFPTLTGFNGGNAIYFDETKKGKDAPKIELFYKSAGRYILLTGDGAPNTEILSGDPADEYCQHLCNQLALDTSQIENAINTSEAPIDSDISVEEVNKMLAVIPCAKVTYADWFKVAAILHLHFGSAGFELWRHWSETDPKRYTLANCQKQWRYLDNRPNVSRPVTIGSLIFFAKKFGYHPPRKSEETTHSNALSPLQNIAPDLKHQLDEAIIWLDTLTPDEFTADTAYNPDNIKAIALAQYFGFPNLYKKFFDTIKAAQSRAKICIADSKSKLTAKLSSAEKKSLNEIVNIGITEIRYAIKRQANAIAKTQNEYVKTQELRQKKERVEKARVAETSRLIEQQSRIDQLRQLPPSPQRDAELVQLIENSCEWKYDRMGNPIAIKATAKNLDLIFTYDPTLDGLIGYDEFRQADVFLKVPTWRKDKGNCIHEEVTDQDAAQIRNYLCRTYSELANKNRVDDWLTEFSHKFSFHEVKEFFRNLPNWDGTQRAKKFFVNFLRADDTPYVHEITLNWLIAAIARIFHAGCDYQLAPILVGEQGIGKSHCIGRLGGKWYGSLIDDVGDPHAVDAIQNLWLVEIKEMAAMKKDVDANKRFIDAREDNRRKAYEKRATKTKRHCVFIVTTNNQQCLIDMTGNRRHPIIKCNAKPRQYVEGLTDDYILQVWSEVFHHYNELFKEGFDEKKLELSKATQIQADEIAEQFTRDDLTEDIKSFIDKKIPPLPIWYQLSREERRKFFTDGNIKLVDGERDLNTRIRTRGGRNAQQTINEIYSILRSNENGIVEHHVTRNGEDLTDLWIYGTQERQHISPLEILHEAFAPTDRRKSIPRIIESLNKIDGWTQGQRFRRIDPAYTDQKIVYYRDIETIED